MAGTDPTDLAQKATVAVGSIGTLLLALRVLFRYERTFVMDARQEIEDQRSEIAQLRTDLAAVRKETDECHKDRVLDRQRIAVLEAEVNALKGNQ